MLKQICAVALLLSVPTALPAQPAPSLADSAIALMPRYAAASAPSELSILAALQLAAGQYAAADASLDRLVLDAEAAPPTRRSRTWLRLYVRVRRHQTEGLEPGEALSKAFAELYATQSDDEAAELLRLYGPDPEALRQRLERAKAACAGAPLEDCTTASDVFVQQSIVDAWALLADARPLIAVDARRRFVVEDQLLLPTPDGAQIATLVIRPRGERLTSLLEFTIYANDDWAFVDAFKMAANGYAGVVAYGRGKGRSPGPIAPYLHDGKDAAAVIEWLARQPWSDGRVGMFSGSYNAFTQWAAAKHRPPALKALATSASNAPGIDTPMQGNVFQSFIYAWPFYTTNNKHLDDATYNDQARWDRMLREWYVSGRPYRELPLIDGAPNPVFSEWLDHPSYDAYWRALVPVDGEFASIDLPVFVQTGYFDGGMVGALHYFREHLRYRADADHRMLIGPYGHTDMQTGVSPVMRGYALDRAAMIDLQDVRLKWFDHVFRGAPLPDILSGRVNFQVMGADRWRHVDTLDDMASSHLRLYLSGAKGDRWFALAAAPGAAPPPLRVDFADRSDVDDLPPFDQLDERNALVFATEPLTQPMEIAGLFRGHFVVEINKRDLDLSIYLFEQDAEGRYLRLASYLGRASYVKDPGRRQLLPSGSPVTLNFESQTVAGRLMPAGSRLIAIVGVPKQAGVQINYGTGRDVSDESIADAADPLEIEWGSGSYLDIGVQR